MNTRDVTSCGQRRSWQGRVRREGRERCGVGLWHCIVLHGMAGTWAGLAIGCIDLSPLTGLRYIGNEVSPQREKGEKGGEGEDPPLPPVVDPMPPPPGHDMLLESARSDAGLWMVWIAVLERASRKPPSRFHDAGVGVEGNPAPQ